MDDPIQELRRLTERATPGTVIYFGGNRVELDGTCAFMHGGAFFGATALEGSRKGRHLDIGERIVRNALSTAPSRPTRRRKTMLDLDTRSRLAVQSEGVAARRLGQPRDRNPYRGHDTEPPSLWCQWDIGWDREDAARAALDRAITTPTPEPGVTLGTVAGPPTRS